MDTALIKRSERVAFYGVPDSSGVPNGASTIFHRMTHFTDMSISKNPKEYKRKYVDEDNERSDITGYSTAIAYNFDYCDGNSVHDDMVFIANHELTADDAARSIVVVDIFKETDNAEIREYAVMPDKEGDSGDVYTFGGSFKSRGVKTFGTATSADGWQTVTFTAE